MTDANINKVVLRVAELTKDGESKDSDDSTTKNSCGDQDKAIMDFIKKGGYIYSMGRKGKRLRVDISKWKVEEKQQIKINFDYVPLDQTSDDDSKYSYIGEYNITKKAIFINTENSNIHVTDVCLIVMSNRYKRWYQWYDYYNIGIMLSFGRHSENPEAKPVIITNKYIDPEIIKKNSMLREWLKQFIAMPNEAILPIIADIIADIIKKN